MQIARDRLDRLLGGPELTNLRQRLRRRYELGRINDRFTLSPVSALERSALEGLLGRGPSLSTTIDLSEAELGEALSRAGLASSLKDALEQIDGPIEDMALERATRDASWEIVFTGLALGPAECLGRFGVSRGLVKRLSGNDPDRGAALLNSTASVLTRLPAQGIPLSRFAADVLGDAHGLDEGRPVSTLAMAVLRVDESGERAREIWARHGLLVSELAAPALVLNLPAQRNSPGATLAERARELGEPLHLSLRTLLRSPPEWAVRGRIVHVCENASIVAMAADRFGVQCAPLVCTDGMPSASQRVLLTQLAEKGADLHYHGDFDWPGLLIGNFVMRTFSARPWRFTSVDYEASRGRKLQGVLVQASWDQHLGTKMERAGYALEEENVVEDLLRDLSTV